VKELGLIIGALDNHEGLTSANLSNNLMDVEACRRIATVILRPNVRLVESRFV
jgi:hypothetical protein